MLPVSLTTQSCFMALPMFTVLPLNPSCVVALAICSRVLMKIKIQSFTSKMFLSRRQRKKLEFFGIQADMGDKCRRYVADPNIGCFQASRCGPIAYRGKMF